MVRLAIDFEFPSREWWENGGQQLWEALAESADAAKVIVDDDLAASWLARKRAVSSCRCTIGSQSSGPRPSWAKVSLTSRMRARFSARSM